MFHYSDLDMFCEDVKPYADADGYVPETKDNLDDFSYPDRQFKNVQSWDHYKQQCVQATRSAQLKLHNWHYNRSH